MLPIEHLVLIVSYCEKPIFHLLLFVNSFLASYELYKEIDLRHLHGSDAMRILKTLANRQDLAALVQAFTVNMGEFSDGDHQYFSNVALQDARRGFGNMVNLKYLHVTRTKLNWRSPSIPHRKFNHVFAAFKSKLIISLITEVEIRRIVLDLALQQESLTEFALPGNPPSANALTGVLQESTSFPGLECMRGPTDTLGLFTKYRTMKKMVIDDNQKPDAWCNSVDVAKVISSKGPDILEIRGFLWPPIWIQVLVDLVAHGSNLKSHAVGLWRPSSDIGD